MCRAPGWYTIPAGVERMAHEDRLRPNTAMGDPKTFGDTPQPLLEMANELKKKLVLSVEGKLRLLDGFTLSHAQGTKMKPGAEITGHVDKKETGDIIVTVVLQGRSTIKLTCIAPRKVTRRSR